MATSLKSHSLDLQAGQARNNADQQDIYHDRLK